MYWNVILRPILPIHANEKMPKFDLNPIELRLSGTSSPICFV